MAAPHRDRAHALEADGMLRAALLEWKVARTIEPDGAEARAGQDRVEARIQALVAERLGEARTSLQRGAHLEARRKLLTVLALDPADRTAAEMLRTEARDVESVPHTVRAGETLASLAERYYGDRARGEVLWDTNQLPPNRPLVVGSLLKIPEIPGLPFNVPGRKAVAPPRPGPGRPAPGRPAVERGGEEPADVNPMLADAREAFDRGDYAAALADVDRYLAQSPSEREGIDLKKLALYRQGQVQLEQKDYSGSYRTLTLLAKLQPDYEDVPRLLQQARRQGIDSHYQEGIRHFRDERLREAIVEWRAVLDLDPQHQNARRNVEQAERLLQALERRKAR